MTKDKGMAGEPQERGPVEVDPKALTTLEGLCLRLK